MSQFGDTLAYILFLRVLTAVSTNFEIKRPCLTSFSHFLSFPLTKMEWKVNLGVNFFKDEYLKICPFYLLVISHEDLHSNRVDFRISMIIKEFKFIPGV